MFVMSNKNPNSENERTPLNYDILNATQTDTLEAEDLLRFCASPKTTFIFNTLL